MKRRKPLFAVGVSAVFAASLLAALVFAPGSALAQTPSAAELAKRKAHVASFRQMNAAAHPVTKSVGAPPAGWTCVGSCGSDNADGVVTLSPTGNSAYEWVSTSGGTNGVGTLPTGPLGSEADGSTLATPTFAAAAGAPLNFYFNYVTSDGSGFADYAWAELFNSSNTPVALLFTARTESSGSIIPGSGLPAPLATLTPSSVPIIGGAPTWGPLGGLSSGACYASGCGYTGWVKSSYAIPTAGNYYLKVGVVNWIDTAYDSGLAVDGVTVSGVPVSPPPSVPGTPVPSSLILTMLGLAAVGTFFASQKFARS